MGEVLGIRVQAKVGRYMGFEEGVSILRLIGSLTDLILTFGLAAILYTVRVRVRVQVLRLFLKLLENPRTRTYVRACIFFIRQVIR